MLPYTPPLWLTVTFVAVAIATNLITVISKKNITKRLNAEQENETYVKGAAYWAHAITSRIADIVNVIMIAIVIYLLLFGATWLGLKFPHIFFVTMCGLMWILSLYLTWVFFEARDKSHDNDAQENDTLIDPNDRAAINYAIGWILFNVTLDGIIWLIAHRMETHIP